MKTFGVIYLILNMVNGKKYVGQTTKSLEERFNQHAQTNSLIGKAIRKYGRENFRCGVIKSCASKEELDNWEKFFIAALKTKSPYGYNLTDGGTNGWEHTPETCAKIAAAHTGKKFSPEHCANISAAQTERFKDPNEREKISAAKTGAKHPFFGKHHTPEHCANISAALTGRVLSPEHCANISAAKINNPLSPEARNRLATTRRGKTRYKNLLSELEGRKLSYHRLAEIMGLSYPSISSKMLGRRNFTDRDKKKLVEIFNKPIEFLLERDE